MLKKRVIPTLLLKDGRMVKGKQFANFRDTGNPSTAVRIYSAQDADELIFIDILPSIESRRKVLSIIEESAKEAFMPLTVGGGIKSLDDIRDLLNAGADKVIITSGAFTEPDLIRKSAEKFGSQCIISGIDFKSGASGLEVWINSNKEKIDISIESHIKRIQEEGAGEIFFNSIDRDGTMIGYDLENLRYLVGLSHRPVIICGGAGNFLHLREAFEKLDVSAVACASLFHFGDNNPIRARSYLRNANIPMRKLK